MFEEKLNESSRVVVPEIKSESKQGESIPKDSYDPEQASLDELRATVQPENKNIFARLGEAISSFTRKRSIDVQTSKIGEGFNPMEKVMERRAQQQQEQVGRAGATQIVEPKNS